MRHRCKFSGLLKCTDMFAAVTPPPTYHNYEQILCLLDASMLPACGLKAGRCCTATVTL